MEQKSVLLLADSQLLFGQVGKGPFLGNYLSGLKTAKAAYIGAANGDRPEFYQLFTAAMGILPDVQCRHIKKEFTHEDETFLRQADLILLAGGNVLYGWHILQQTGMADIVVQRYYAGSYLIGVSAGAIHLGLAFVDDENQLYSMTKCIPFVIDVHQQNENWWRLMQTLKLMKNPYIRGIGIPFGAGVFYHADHSVESIGKPVWLFEQVDDEIKHQLLLPENFKFEKEVGKA